MDTSNDRGLVRIPDGSLITEPMLAAYQAHFKCNRDVAMGSLRDWELGKGEMDSRLVDLDISTGSTLFTNIREAAYEARHQAVPGLSLSRENATDAELAQHNLDKQAADAETERERVEVERADAERLSHSVTKESADPGLAPNPTAQANTFETAQEETDKKAAQERQEEADETDEDESEVESEA